MLTAFCREHGVATLALFGSALRDDFHAGSDIDLLVAFRPETRIGFLGVARLERQMATLFGGRKVDLRTRAELSPYIRPRVEREARLLVDLTEEAAPAAAPAWPADRPIFRNAHRRRYEAEAHARCGARGYGNVPGCRVTGH